MSIHKNGLKRPETTNTKHNDITKILFSHAGKKNKRKHIKESHNRIMFTPAAQSQKYKMLAKLPCFCFTCFYFQWEWVACHSFSKIKKGHCKLII